MDVGLSRQAVKTLFQYASNARETPGSTCIMTHRWLSQLFSKDDIARLVSSGVLVEYEEVEVIQTDEQPEGACLLPHPVDGRLCYYEEGSLVYVQRKDTLRYRLNLQELISLLHQLLELPEKLAPVERIPGVMWELGRISAGQEALPVWFCCSLANHHGLVSELLEQHKTQKPGVLLIGQPVDKAYTRLPAILDVRVIGDLLDPWSVTTRINKSLLISSCGFAQTADVEAPFFMPPNDAYILLNRTGEKYKLRGDKRKKFFRYIFEEGRDARYQVSFRKALQTAGYEDEYSSVKSLFKEGDRLREIVSNEGDVLTLREVPN
ncbi:hypothetical protein [Endozoicomonas sp. 8E]|uniref:hypothetical protein n=1 Tax=Endozoicomonas sp. 8E TaxID=3035692 RepID=UPI002939487E|nr:hypothetical protein [Endozoicomonas sp. 8E]WOG29862.1 hypothetical protein P6910_09465 [Endozoicomonas sp. 8E]